MLFLYRIEKIRKRLRIITSKKPNFIAEVRLFEVVPPGIEPGTQGFSVLCSTN